MELSQVELRNDARWIRDSLGPMLAQEGSLMVDSLTLSCVRELLQDLEHTAVTIDMLRFSRIDKALVEIWKNGDLWPADMVLRAKDLVVCWEDVLGPLKNLRAELWASGGRLEDVRRVKPWKDDSTDHSVGERSCWMVEGERDPSRAYIVGHNAFEIGDWWIKPAAAFRDGMIDESLVGITADESGAYAIVMTDEQEFWPSGDYDLVGYIASSKDPGVNMLRRGLLSRQPVRLLRTSRLRSIFAPEAGVRYDGLHRVEQYGLRLFVGGRDGKGQDEHCFTFQLRRLNNQAGIGRALLHPASDELDDWEDYQHAKQEQRGFDLTCLQDGEVVKQLSRKKGRQSQYWFSLDSGYNSISSSRRPSKDSDAGFVGLGVNS